MSLTWDEVAAYALSLPGTQLSSYYGKPAVKAKDRPIVTLGGEATSFCLHLDRDRVEMVMTIDPAIFWQTPHYECWPVVLVRYDAADWDMVRDQIAASHDRAVARPQSRKRPA